jgi:signal transduction histidine kinase
MKDLVESLLTLARIESGTLAPAMTEIRLRPLVDEAAAELEPLARHHRVRVFVEGEAVAWADRVQMRILLTNLLSNAIRYNRPEGEVRVEVSNSGGRTRLQVSDTGVGLDPAAAAHAFERFWRADPARSGRDGGTGLGLAISKAVTDAHAGTIAVRSEPQKGTTFVVDFPMSEARSASSEEATD